jgi:hypothetical protein
MNYAVITGSVSIEEINKQANEKKSVANLAEGVFYLTGLKSFDIEFHVGLYLNKRNLKYTTTKEDLYASGISKFFGFQKERIKFVVLGEYRLVEDSINQICAWFKKT